jgi:hypothetical protein
LKILEGMGFDEVRAESHRTGLNNMIRMSFRIK